MKTLLAATLLLIGTSVAISAADRSPIYPFDVKIGGHLAIVEGDPNAATFARIKDPVAADAEIEVTGAKGTIIVSIFPVEANGIVPPGTQPKVIMAQDSTKVKLNATKDKTTIEPGLYGANIVFAGATARVMFTVK